MASKSLDSVFKGTLVLKIKFDRVHIVLSELVYCRLCIKISRNAIVEGVPSELNILNQLIRLRLAVSSEGFN